MRFDSRLNVLERTLDRESAKQKIRLIVCRGGPGPLDLPNSTCTRRGGPTGLVEIVDVAGNDEELTQEALDAFVASFPVE